VKSAPQYLMENEQEVERLERKTDTDVVRQQAQWAGIKPGMRVADIGCGSGITTQVLHQLAQPGGEAIGVDMSEDRIAYAAKTYGGDGISFKERNLLEPIDDLGGFDFIWVRFFLEYHRSAAFDIVKNLASATNPGGIICLIDLDYNCLSHFGMSEQLLTTLHQIMHRLEKTTDFDPHAGIKLYSFLYDLGFENIDVSMSPHHLIYGELKEVDAFNWEKKLAVAVKKSGFDFSRFPGGYDGFSQAFQSFFSHPRRFTYTPMIACCGRKPN